MLRFHIPISRVAGSSATPNGTRRFASEWLRNKTASASSFMGGARRSQSTAAPAASSVDMNIHPSWPSARNKRVGVWMFTSAAVVCGVVVIGGVTRLTESGLSIVEWRPVTGVLPPITHEEWEAEFEKYKKFPEYHQRINMTLADFQFIFFWEWAHRVLARSIGIVYGAPLVYFACRGYFRGNAKLGLTSVGILALGGAQGFMGWYMVRSGLDMRLLDEKRKATVSAYRLASHLFLAFTIYAFLVRTGYGLRLPVMTRFPGFPSVQLMARVCFGTMFATAMSGALVAGLDAGLMYNDDFPWMGGGVFPPADHLWVSEPWWLNFFENPAGVQAVHRVMAGTTTALILTMNVVFRQHRSTAPRMVKRGIMHVNHALGIQVALGLWTLLSYVDIPVAAAHQAGSLLLLTTLIRLCAILGSRGTVLLP